MYMYKLNVLCNLESIEATACSVQSSNQYNMNIDNVNTTSLLSFCLSSHNAFV